MPYRYESFANGQYYHVYNRGLNKGKIFLERRDYQKFLELVDEVWQQPTIQGKFQIHAYCIMSNHYHLLVEQISELPLNSLIYKLQMRYAKYFNIKHNHHGNVFEGRFKVKGVDSDEYLLQVSKYIHRNPLVARLVKQASLYEWSSLQWYLGDVKPMFLTTSSILDYYGRKNPVNQYSQFVNQDFDELDVFRIKDLTHDLEENHEFDK